MNIKERNKILLDCAVALTGESADRIVLRFSEQVEQCATVDEAVERLDFYRFLADDFPETVEAVKMARSMRVGHQLGYVMSWDMLRVEIAWNDKGVPFIDASAALLSRIDDQIRAVSSELQKLYAAKTKWTSATKLDVNPDWN